MCNCAWFIQFCEASFEEPTAVRLFFFAAEISVLKIGMFSMYVIGWFYYGQLWMLIALYKRVDRCYD